MLTSRKYRGYLLALAATVIWSGNFIVARGLKDNIPPVSLSVFRWGTAALVLLPFAWKGLVADWPMVRKQLKLLIPISFLGISVFNTLLYMAAHHTSAVNMSLIAISGPLFVALLNKFIFREKFGALRSTGFVVVIAGLLLLITKGDLSALTSLRFSKGDLLMAGGAFLFSFYTVLLKLKNPGIRSGSILLFTFLAGTIMLLPFWGVEIYYYEPEMHFDGKTLGQIAYIGIGASLLSYYCWNNAVELIGSTNTSAVYNLLPLFSAIAAAVFLGEKLLPVQAISGIVILVGLFLITRVRKPSRSPSPAA